jgi:hypothetical protein
VTQRAPIIPEDFCEYWKHLGTLQKDPENPRIQELEVLGLFHYQYGSVNGRSAEGDFEYDTAELRRRGDL